jgi:hypothetical protein
VIVDILFKCDGCGGLRCVPAKLVVRPRNDGKPHMPFEGVEDPVIELPAGWRRSYGASGCGLYHLCGICEAKKIRLNDVRNGHRSGQVVVEEGGFHDD